MTLSASEVHWEGLLALLQKLKINPEEALTPVQRLTLCERSQLVSDDPNTCGVYFEYIVSVIMSILHNKNISPFAPYCVVEQFKRIKFQHRGSAHAHILLWLNGAPNGPLGPDMPENISYRWTSPSFL